MASLQLAHCDGMARTCVAYDAWSMWVPSKCVARWRFRADDMTLRKDRIVSEELQNACHIVWTYAPILWHNALG